MTRTSVFTGFVGCSQRGPREIEDFVAYSQRGPREIEDFVGYSQLDHPVNRSSRAVCHIASHRDLEHVVAK